MKIHFVSHAENHLASHRMRVLKPVELLKARGHDATFGNTADAKAEVNVFQKHMNMGYDEAMASILKGHTKIAFDVSDDHLDRHHGEHYKTMINSSDIVTVNGPALMGRVQGFFPDKKLHYVKDPITFPFRNVPRELSGKPKLLWYGHSSNFDTVKALEDSFEDPLTVITNQPFQGKFTFIQWDVGVVEKEIENFDIVVLPLRADVSKHTKNTNRAVDALASGKFVVTDSPEVYGDLAPYIYIGDIDEGIKWYKENLKEARNKIAAGQDVVREIYSDIVIADQWEMALVGKITRKMTEVA